MQAIWTRFKGGIYPYTPSRYSVLNDDDTLKLKQPLMAHESSDEEEYNDLEEPQHDSDNWGEKRRRPRENYYKVAQKYIKNDNYAMSVEPKFLRSTDRVHSTSSIHANVSYTMPSRIRSMVKTRRKTSESMEDLSEQALVRMAALTVAMALLLIVTVYRHAA